MPLSYSGVDLLTGGIIQADPWSRSHVIFNPPDLLTNVADNDSLQLRMNAVPAIDLIGVSDP